MSQPIRTIIERTAEAFGVPVAQITGERRQGRIIVARHVAMALARDLTSAGFPRIGRAFGRHHTTIMAGVRRCEERLVADPDLAARVNALREALAKELPPC